MADWNYTLGLDAKPFVAGASEAKTAEEEMAAAIKAGAKEGVDANKSLTESLKEAGKAAAEAQKSAAGETKAEGDDFWAKVKADIKGVSDAAPAAKTAMEDVGHAGKKAGEGVGHADKEMSKMGKNVEAIKDMGKGMVFGALMEGTAMLRSELDKTHPVAGAVVGSLTNIGTAAAQGAMVAGPWGAAIAGALSAVAEGYRALSGPSQDQIDADERALETAKNLTEQRKEYADAVKEAAAAGREYAKVFREAQSLRSDREATAEDGQIDFRARLSQAALATRRAAAGGLSGREAITTNAGLDKEAIDLKYRSEQDNMEARARRTKADQVETVRARDSAYTEKEALPAHDQKGREALQAQIDGFNKNLIELNKAAYDAAAELAAFKAQSPQLAAAEKQTVDTRVGVAMTAEAKKEEDEKFKEHDRIRKRDVDKKNEADARKKAEEDEAARRQTDLRNEAAGLTGKIESMQDDDDADGPRTRRGPAAARPRIKGIISRGSYQRDRSGRASSMGMRASDDTKDPRIAAKGRPSAESGNDKQLAAMLKRLDDIHKELRKSNSPKK